MDINETLRLINKDYEEVTSLWRSLWHRREAFYNKIFRRENE